VTMWGTDEVRVRIFINQGDGSFVEGDSYLIGYDTSSQGIYCADFDLDGDVDMAIGRWRGEGETGYLLIFLNNGNATFADYVEYETGEGTGCIYGNDFSGDGSIDMFLSTMRIDKIVILFNDGFGVFLFPIFYDVGDAPDGIDGGDFDNDGDIDLVVANQYSWGSDSGTISVLMNEGGVVPNIGTSTRLLSFGIVNVGDSVKLPLDVYNLGYDTLLIGSLSIIGSVFTVNDSSFTLLPESTKTIIVTFTPVTDDSVEDTLTICSNDPDSPEWQVILRGNYPLVVVEEKPNLVSSGYRLYSCYPNPFSTTTRIDYNLPDISYVKLEIYNLLGEKVKVLVDEKQASGVHSVCWKAGDLPGGIYFCQMRAGGFISTRKVVILR